MYNHLLYFSYWLFNSIVIYIFGLLFPSSVVLGNYRFNPIESSIYAGFWVTFFVWSFWDFALAKGIKLDSATVMFGYFWAANIFAFWIVSRFSQIAGFGLANYLWAAILGVAGYFVQRLAWKMVVRGGGV